MNPFLNAKPIWHPDDGGVNQTVLFTGTVSITDPSSCRLFIHAHTNYALFLNDVFVFSGAFSDYETWRIYDEIPLKEFLHEGDNAFLLYAYDQGEDSFIYRYYPPEVIFSLWEGNEEIFLSDAGIPCQIDTRFASSVPKITPQLSYSFDFDMTRPLPPSRPAAQAGQCPLLYPRPVERPIIQSPATGHVVSIGKTTTFTDPLLKDLPPADKMQQAFRHIQKPEENLALPSKEGLTLSDPCIIIDLEKERAGFFLLDIDLPKDSEILIGWGEHLDDQAVRTRIGARHFAARLFLSKGRQQFLYPLKRMGLRYLELHIDAPAYTLYYAGVRPVTYPLKQLTQFHCDDHLHEQIYRTAIRTLTLCMHEHYEDCPWREQALYTMDSRNQMLMGYYAFNELAFPKASLKLIALSLREDHLLELISPGKADITIPSFSLIYLIQAAEYLKYSDDIAFIREIRPVLSSIIKGFKDRIDETGLVPRLMEDPENGIAGKYWNFYEWQDGLDGHGKDNDPGQIIYDAPLNAFFALALKSYASICLALGDHKSSVEASETLMQLKKNYIDAFYEEDSSLFASFLSLPSNTRCHYAELTQALSVVAGLVPEGKINAILHHLAYDNDEDLIPVTLSHGIFKYEALLTDPEHYGAFVFELIATEYGKMLRQGATTFYETKEGADAFDKAGSLCHGWSAVPVYLYLKYLADVKDEGCKIPETITHVPNVSTTLRDDPALLIEQYF